MAAHTESDESADLFWPGYVDAVTNLAINLLFVIAVMSIVVIAITMQISKMTDKTPVTEARQEVVKSAAAAVAGDQTGHEQVRKLQQALAESRQQLEQTLHELRQAQVSLQKTQTQFTETVQARQNKPVDPKSANRVLSLPQEGVVVVFSPDVMTLSPTETSELMALLRKMATQSTGRWEISAISPKGLSESVRVAYYRVNAVRNALLANGISSQAIDIRIHESAQPEADNSKVLVRWLP